MSLIAIITADEIIAANKHAWESRLTTAICFKTCSLDLIVLEDTLNNSVQLYCMNSTSSVAAPKNIFIMRRFLKFWL